MRTALFFVALAIRDVAEALGKAQLKESSFEVLIILVLIAMVMDVVDFLRGKK